MQSGLFCVGSRCFRTQVFLLFASLLAWFPSLALAGPAIEFGNPQTVATGTSNPYAPFLADLDGDGDIDLAHNHYEDNFLNIYLNDGSGVFGAPTLIALALDGGRGGRNLHGGDLDGDGDIDLVTGISQATNNGHVLVFLNNGDATFAAPQTILSTDRPRTIVVEDMNGDTYEDVVVITDNTANIRVLLNDGAGNFAQDQVLSGPFGMSHFVIGDFDGDSRPDIAAYSSNNKQIAIYLTQGTPGLVQVAIYATGGSNGDIVAVDLEKDGDLDILAGSNTNVEDVLALTNDGSGGFTVSTNLDLNEPLIVQPLADFNGDGNLDLPVLLFSTSEVVTIYEGDGSDQFSSPVTLVGSGPVPRYVDTADLNGDGLPDLVAVNVTSPGSVKIFLNESGEPLQNTKIAFASDRDGDFEIYVMNSDGTGLVQLTDNESFDSYPKWSPDGSKILFTSQRDGNDEVYVMSSDGSNPVNLTNNAAFDVGSDWSPDGSQIAFHSMRDASTSEVYLMEANGSNIMRLTNNSVHDNWAAWSPDGSLLAYNNYASGPVSIYTMNLDGTNKALLIPNFVLVDWHPDGDRITYRNHWYSAEDIYTRHADGSNIVQLTNHPARDWSSTGTWSPQGTKVAFVSSRDGNSEIYLMNEDGSNQTRLTFDGANDEYPTWSPVLQDISIPVLTSSYASPIDVPVQVGETAGKDIVAAEVSVAYDGNLLIPTSVPVSSTAMTSAWSIEHNVVQGVGTNIDTIKIALADEMALSGSGDLLTLHFTTTDTRMPASSVLDITHALFNDGTPGAFASDGSVTITGNDATGSTYVATIIPRESIAVTIIDPDEDLDGAGSTDDVTVAVSNGLQSETLTLLETATPGEFAGSISTVFDAASTAAAQSGDNTVQVKAGDQIAFVFVDQLLSDGSGPVDLVLLVNAIGGTDGTVEITQVTQPGDVVYLKVTDADLNDADQVVETVQVMVTSSNGETETVTLTEVDVDDAVFFGSLSSAPGASAGTDDDGAINGVKGDVLTATYDDVVTVLGDQLDRIATDQVVDPFGDADGNGNVQAFDAAQVLLHVLSPFITGLELLQANVDTDPSGTGITPFDASLILQKRVGLISVFPVQEAASTNHPQLVASSPKSIVDLRQLSLVAGEGYVSVVADGRAGIVSGEVVLSGVEGAVVLPEDLGDFLTASRATEEGLRIAFAGAEAVSGPGELLRVYGVGPEPARLVRASFNDGWIEAQIGASSMPMPATYALLSNVPNPFNPETAIGFSLPQAGRVELVVYDALGQRVRELVSSHWSAGVHSATWDGRSDTGAQVSSGVYFYRLRAGDFVQTRRMLLLK